LVYRATISEHLPSFPTRRSSDLDQPLPSQLHPRQPPLLEVLVDRVLIQPELLGDPLGLTIVQRYTCFSHNEIDLDKNTVYKYLRSEEHTSELQSHLNLVCRLLLE